MIARLTRDLRHAARALRRRPGYLSACVATLALALGANTALFATINATFFRDVPLRDGGRLVRLYTLPPDVTDPAVAHHVHEAELLRFREQSRTLEDFASWAVRERALTGEAEPLVVRDAAVTAELLTMAEAPPVLGRAFGRTEELAGDRVVVLSHGLWERAFGGRASVLGEAVSLDGQPYEVVGVMPPGFPPHFLAADLFTPLGIGPRVADGGLGRGNLITLARLVDGVGVVEASAEIGALMAEEAALHPGALTGWRAGVTSVREWRYGSLKTPFLVLLGATILLLVIACVNIGALALAQFSARARELDLRRALGDTRAGVARLVVSELLLVNLLGAFAGLITAQLLLPLLLAIDPTATRALGPVRLDASVGGYALLSALAATALSGVLPVMRVGTRSVASGGVRVRGGRMPGLSKGGLLVVQTGVCLALLVSGGLLLDSLRRASSIEPGFQPEGVLTAQVRLSRERHGTHEARVQIVEQLLERLRGLPGVEAVATGMNDFIPGNQWVAMVRLEDRPTVDGSPHSVQLRRVSGQYFSTMGIPLVAGRDFDARDGSDGVPTAVVSRAFANRFWPGEDAIGKRIEGRAVTWTVVGVAGDASDVDLLEPPEPTLYVPWTQNSSLVAPVALVLRTVGDPAASAASVRSAVRAVDPLLPVDRVVPLQHFLDDSLAPTRFRVALLLCLGIVGLTLAGLGVAAMTAQSIGERMSELGVRLALGSGRWQLWGLAMKGQLVHVASGAAVGVGLAILLGRVLASFLPGVEGFDASVTGGALLLVGVTAVVATAVSAARVLRVNPLWLLRPGG